MAQVTSSITSVISDDPDVEKLELIFTLKDGKTVTGTDSFFHERVLLKYIANTIPTWVTYIRDNKMKTF